MEAVGFEIFVLVESATAKEGQDAKVRGWIRADAKRIVENLRAGCVPEWANAWILNERGPLIA
jgi:hypothetical protein